MRIFLLLFFITLLAGCATVEVAKEVAKVSQSIKISVDNMLDSVEKNKEILETEKIEEKKLVTEQKKITDINFSGKNLIEIKLALGVEGLNRIDGETQLVRYDNNNCRLFLFFNTAKKNSKVEHFEIRNLSGNLIESKEKIKKCYKEFNLI